MLRITILIICSFTVIYNVEAQSSFSSDTLSFSMQDAENMFLINNYDLLAAKYQINEADASVIQARLWDNPNFNFEQGAFNKNTGKWFDFSPSGESAASLQQLIYLAGKRNKRINIEKINLQIARYEFYDLIRTLRYELRTSFFGLYCLQQTLSVYDRELEPLKILINAYDTEYQKGNVAFKELARLQALQFSLENEKLEVMKDASEKQANLILLTGDSLSRPIKPIISPSSLDVLNPDSDNLAQLIDSALNNRYDLKIAESQIESERLNLSLQKAMRIPDLTVGARYDKAGSYVPDYNAISLGFDLPIWNHNQGNIKISENKIEENKVIKAQKELEVKSDITRAYTQFIETDKLYKSSFRRFDSNYEKLFGGLTEAYKNHTISLLEFIDYFETYKDSKNEYYHLINNRFEAVESLNLAIGKTMIK